MRTRDRNHLIYKGNTFYLDCKCLQRTSPVGVTRKPRWRYLQRGFSIKMHHECTTDFGKGHCKWLQELPPGALFASPTTHKRVFQYASTNDQSEVLNLRGQMASTESMVRATSCPLSARSLNCSSTGKLTLWSIRACS